MKCKNGFLTVLTALVSLVLLLLPIAQVKGDECPHQWVMVSATPATCTESGYEVYHCSLCTAEHYGALPSGDVGVATNNRNFIGKVGKGSHTYLLSPMAAMATAIRGCITDPRDFLN